MCLFIPGGCSDSVVKQYTELDQWRQSGDAPTMLSGTPEADVAAYEASQDALSEANWEIMQQIAPRPIWEKIAKARELFKLQKPKKKNIFIREKIAKAEKKTHESSEPSVRRIPGDVKITKRSDGKLRVVYPLHHYGGSTATSSYDGGTRRKVKVDPVDLTPMVKMINQQLGDKGNCSPLPNDNALVITCEQSARDEVMQLMADVDRPNPQVEITARIFEIRHDFDFQYGAKTILEHLASDSQQRVASQFSTKAFLDSLSNSSLGDSAYQGSTMKLFQIFGDSGITLSAVFQALADTGLIREVASPRMTVLAGKTGSMLAGQELPITTARYATDTIVTEKTTYRPVGVQLYVTPQTIGEDSVKLHVLTVVSSVAGFNPRMALEGTDSLQTITNPVFNSREAETSVTVPDANTLVVGGLRMIRHITRERKIPGLGDIWGIEWLFKSHRSQRQINDLYFFVTPRIINNQ